MRRTAARSPSSAIPAIMTIRSLPPYFPSRSAILPPRSTAETAPVQKTQKNMSSRVAHATSTWLMLISAASWFLPTYWNTFPGMYL